MDSLLEKLSEIVAGRTAFLGIGNADLGDDGAGMALAERLEKTGITQVFKGGVHPESAIPRIRHSRYDTVIFLDAVDVSHEPGSVVIMDANELVGKFPQISTHKLSLSTLARIVTDGYNARVWLVGIQPKTLSSEGPALSDPVDKTVTMLAQQFAEIARSASSHTVQEQICNSVL